MVEDRVTVISGAGGSLGEVVTRKYAEAGARLALLDRSTEKLDAMTEELELDKGRVLNHTADLSDMASTQAVAQAVKEKFGRVDILINLVGGWIGGKALLEIEDDDLSSMLQQHVWASYIMVKSFVPYMQVNDWGRVLAVSSPSASRPPGNNSPYAIGKAGLEALMMSLAQEMKFSGITANLVLVNTIDTKHKRINNPSEKNRNWTTPEEISATLLHLSSDEAGMINGARIPLFGEPH